MKRKEKALIASQETLKVVYKYLLSSGAILAILVALQAGLLGVEAGETTWGEFGRSMGYLVLGNLINSAIVFVTTYTRQSTSS